MKINIKKLGKGICVQKVGDKLIYRNLNPPPEFETKIFDIIKIDGDEVEIR